MAWHFTRELDATGVFENMTSYRELVAGFTVRFHDLNGQASGAFLNLDPAVVYSAGQTLARDVLGSGGNGLLYRSARHDAGQCLVALRLPLVRNVRQRDTWVFEWAGAPAPSIMKSVIFFCFPDFVPFSLPDGIDEAEILR